MIMDMLVLRMNVLIKHKMSPNQFFLGYLIAQKNTEVLIEYVTQVHPFWVTDLSYLAENGFIIDLNEDPNDFSLRDAHITEKFRMLMEANINIHTHIEMPLSKVKEQLISKQEAIEKFNLFWEAYPKKRGVSSVPLRQKRQYCEGLYIKFLTRDSISHANIMKGLEREKVLQLRNSAYQYMQSTDTWLRNKGWEPHLEELNDKQGGQKTYGGKIE